MAVKKVTVTNNRRKELDKAKRKVSSSYTPFFKFINFTEVKKG